MVIVYIYIGLMGLAFLTVIIKNIQKITDKRPIGNDNMDLNKIKKKYYRFMILSSAIENNDYYIVKAERIIAKYSNIYEYNVIHELLKYYAKQYQLSDDEIRTISDDLFFYNLNKAALEYVRSRKDNMKEAYKMIPSENARREYEDFDYMMSTGCTDIEKLYYTFSMIMNSL